MNRKGDRGAVAWRTATGDNDPELFERSGMGNLREGQKVSFDLQEERGKTSACNLKTA